MLGKCWKSYSIIMNNNDLTADNSNSSVSVSADIKSHNRIKAADSA